MKKILFSLISLALVFASCGGPDPVKFNDALTKANDVITKVSSAYDTDITNALLSENYGVIAAKTDSALVKIDAEIEVVKALEVPKGGETFKDAALKSYQSLRDLVEAGRGFSTLTSESPDEELTKLAETYEAKASDYEKAFGELAAAQLAYAKEAGYQVR